MIFKQLFDPISSTYTYLIASRQGAEALIIDPVLENVDLYIELMNQLNLRLVKVIDTHIHADHVSGIDELRDKTNCVTIMGDASPANIVSMQVSDNEDVKIENISLKALYTPGHTKDSFSFLMADRLFSGDALLIRGTGRTDFQNGDPYDAYNSLFERLLKLPEKTLLYPAHDYNGNTVSSIGEEKKFNPRLQVKNAEEYANIMNNLNLPNPKMMDVAIPKNLNHGIDYINQKKFNGLTTEEFINLIHKQSSILIDLREKSEIEKFGKIKNSINIPLRQLLDYLHSNETELSDKKILFYCAVGQRSSLAVKIASSYKFNSCFHLIGGLKLWIEKNFYLEE